MKEAMNLMYTPIAGVQHHTTRDLLEEIAENGEQTELALVREPKNQFDEYAVIVETKVSHTKLGYIPASHSMVFAALMDGGYEIQAKLEEVIPRKALVNISLSILRDAP